MGMFEKPQYLTGKDGTGFVQVGEVFWLHNAKIEGTSTINGEQRTQAKLLVSHGKDDRPIIVFTSGKAITGMVARIDADDRAAMPIEVRLDALPSRQGNPTNVISRASDPPAGGGGDDLEGGPGF